MIFVLQFAFAVVVVDVLVEHCLVAEQLLEVVVVVDLVEVDYSTY